LRRSGCASDDVSSLYCVRTGGLVVHAARFEPGDLFKAGEVVQVCGGGGVVGDVALE
jgi:hypothetical protein